MKADREPVADHVIGIVVGLGMIAIALARFWSGTEFLPNDPRSQPWFDLLIGPIGAVVGILVFSVASLRLLQGLQRRR